MCILASLPYFWCMKIAFSKLGGHLEAEKHHVILKYLQGVTSLICMGVHLEVFRFALRGLLLDMLPGIIES